MMESGRMPWAWVLLLSVALVVAAVAAWRARRRRPAKLPPWPTPSYEEVMKTDAILRKLSGADEAERRAERRKEQRADAAARMRKANPDGDLP